MRPYLAILKDSVREAVRSRTLPFLLAFFTVVLAGVAPLGLRDETAWRLESGDLLDARLLLGELRRDEAKAGPQPGDQVLAALPADVRRAVLSTEADAAPVDAERLRSLLNDDVLTASGFYDEAAFDGVRFNRPNNAFGAPDEEAGEAERLLAEGPKSLPAERLGRLNRLLLSAAFPQAIAAPQDERVFLIYGPWDLPEDFTEFFAANLGLELNRSGVRFIARLLIEPMATWVAGPVGVLIALLVTASLIPQTFEAGAIDLLLSKPVYRTATFLTKFAGGCVFVGLAGLYLCGGLWLIAGVRLGVWDAGLIAAAGILVMQFAVLYSVSAAVGVLWQNAIVCVMASGVVWALSFVVNAAWHQFELWAEQDRPAAVVAGEGEVFQADVHGRVTRWEPNAREWRPALYPPGRRDEAETVIPTYRLAGPHFVPAERSLAALEIYSVSGGPGGTVRSTGSRRLYTATAANDWEGTAGAVAPPLTTHLLIRPDGAPLFAGRLGVYTPWAEGEGPEAPTAGMLAAAVQWIAQQTYPQFEPVIVPPADGSRSPSFAEPFAAAIDPQTGDLAIYAGGVLRLYRAGAAEPAAEITLYDADGPAGKPGGPPAVVVAAGERGALVVAGEGVGKAVAADGSVRDFAPVPGHRPRGFAADPQTGRLALATHGGPLWVGSIDGRGEIVTTDASAGGWGEEGALWIGSGPDEVTQLQPNGDGFREAAQFAPEPGWLADFHRLAITPLHYLLPDSVGLSATLSQLVLGGEVETQEAFGADLDLRQPLLTSNFWGPLIHNFAFMAAILALTSWHVSRTDF
ncbi:ABC transporter permease [Alienimonas californiensis]|uniref:ABC-2 family transporter protein n=1 Tax=Alienimonas californiensis TaxID=2527989 RepID=A0A517PEJ3_9PLAN|nr:ABC transporter permease [Alienimonas californiensis]QDT17799.1 ABC-2 family transporter protein [Alienimonas californiensis]